MIRTVNLSPNSQTASLETIMAGAKSLYGVAVDAPACFFCKFASDCEWQGGESSSYPLPSPPLSIINPYFPVNLLSLFRQ